VLRDQDPINGAAAPNAPSGKAAADGIGQTEQVRLHAEKSLAAQGQLRAVSLHEGSAKRRFLLQISRSLEKTRLRAALRTAVLRMDRE